MLDEKTISKLNKQGLYSTGEFAKMLNIEKSMLHYYDSIGLFSPDIVNDNGYRYYSWRQFDDIMLILMLREIGMPISEIKEYKQKRTPQRFAVLLRNISHDIERELQRLLRLQNFINGRREITEEALSAPLHTIEIKKFQEEYFFVTPFDGDPYIIDDAYIIEADHNKKMNEARIYSPYSVGEITKKSNNTNSQVIHHSYFQTKLNSKEDRPNPWVRDAGDYLTLYHRSGYWYTPEYEQKMLAFAEKHHYQTGDYFYEEYLLDELSSNISDSYLIRISIRVYK